MSVQKSLAFTNRTIYYLPGHGGQLATGLGQGLMDRGFDVTGRETRGDFCALPFDEQLQIIADDLHPIFGIRRLRWFATLSVLTCSCTRRP